MHTDQRRDELSPSEKVVPSQMGKTEWLGLISQLLASPFTEPVERAALVTIQGKLERGEEFTNYVRIIDVYAKVQVRIQEANSKAHDMKVEIAHIVENGGTIEDLKNYVRARTPFPFEKWFDVDIYDVTPGVGLKVEITGYVDLGGM